MARVPYPPINKPIIVDGKFTQDMVLWFESVDRRIAEVLAGGGTSGSSIGTDQTRFEIQATGNIYINGLLLNYPTDNAQVATSDGLNGIEWTDSEDLAATPTGVVRVQETDSVPEGWIELDDGTIGSSSSTATNRANDDTLALYTLLWNSCSDTNCPVSGGRGATAAADFAANKRLTLPKCCGRGFRVMSGSGTLGATQGVDTKAIAENQAPEHKHLIESQLPDGSGITPDYFYAGWPYTNFTGNYRYIDQWLTLAGGTYSEYSNLSEGGGQAMNIRQETVYHKALIKL